MVSKYWADREKHRFSSDSNELEMCVQTSMKPQKPRKNALKITKKLIRVGTRKKNYEEFLLLIYDFLSFIVLFWNIRDILLLTLLLVSLILLFFLFKLFL